MRQRPLFIPQLRENPHLEGIVEYFGVLEQKPADINNDLEFVFIGFTNRCGSNYVAELLASDGRLPLGGEYLNFDAVVDNSKKHSLLSFQEYFSFLMRQTAYKKRAVIKVAPSHIELLAQSGILMQIFDRSRFVLIERSDKLDQAISHVIAFQTGKFTSKMTGYEGQEAKFDARIVSRVINSIAEDYRFFSSFFGLNGIKLAHVIYEQVVQDPQRAVTYIGNIIGLPDLQVMKEKLSLERQANAMNAEWRRMYLANPVSL